MENQNNRISITENNKSYQYILAVIKFLTLSSLGIFLFMVPITQGGKVIIPVATLSSYVQESLAELLPYIITGIILITAFLTTLTKILKPKFVIENSFLNSLFNVNNAWFVIRLLGGIFIVCTLFQIGPEVIWSENTGGMILSDLLPILFSVFLFSGLFLPLLLNFGLLEFVGSLLVKIMRPFFNLPGSAAIDCIASWLGDGTIGVMLTSKQYEDGYYTEREACVIGTTFSLVSITFSLVIIDTVRLSNMFVPFYLSVTFVSLVAAILVPKLPPLSKKRNIYHNGSNNSTEDILTDGYTPLKFGLEKAINKANSSSLKRDVVFKGTLNIIDMWFGVIPVVMAIGTIALILAEYTPLFQILGMPFVPILKLLQIPEAVAASSTLISGFADMLLPSIMSSGIQSEMTQFIIAATSITQLIYLSEVGALLLGSKIPINIKELFIIFIERTLITLPIISLIAHIIF